MGMPNGARAGGRFAPTCQLIEVMNTAQKRRQGVIANVGGTRIAPAAITELLSL